MRREDGPHINIVSLDLISEHSGELVRQLQLLLSRLLCQVILVAGRIVGFHLRGSHGCYRSLLLNLLIERVQWGHCDLFLLEARL